MFALLKVLLLRACIWEAEPQKYENIPSPAISELCRFCPPGSRQLSPVFLRRMMSKTDKEVLQPSSTMRFCF